MLQILSHTPVWFFVLFAILVVFAVLQTRDRKIKLLVINKAKWAKRIWRQGQARAKLQ